MLNSSQIDKVIYFILLYGKYGGTEDQLRYLINKHNEYETLEVIWMGEDVAAYSRHNIIHETVVVIDAIVRPEFRHKQFLKAMLLNGLRKFPNVRFMRYQRGWKSRKEDRTFNIKKFLNIKENHVT